MGPASGVTRPVRRAAGRAAVALLATATLLLAGCSGTTSGHGSALGASPTGTPTETPTGTPSGSPAPSGFPRTPLNTGIGDPATRDVCAGVPLAPLRRLGYQAAYAQIQLQPGCLVSMTRGGRLIYRLSAQAATRQFSDTPVGTAVQHGLTVRSFGYDDDTGDCAREIDARGVAVKIDVVPNVAATRSSRQGDCAASARMADGLTARIARGPLPRLRLADPSVTSVDLCAALEAVDLSSLSLFDDADIADERFGMACDVDPSHISGIVEFETTSTGVTKDARETHADGHTLYFVPPDNGSVCNVISPQGRTGNGYIEQVSITASLTGSSADDLCDQSAQVLGRLLTSAGLH